MNILPLEFFNLSTVLRAAGSSLQHVVKMTIFMADAGAFAQMNELYGEYFPHNPPVRSTPIVQLPARVIDLDRVCSTEHLREGKR